MNTELQARFISQWEKYFPQAELPITAFYTHGDAQATPAAESQGRSCIVCELARVRKGASVSYCAKSIACGGARRYLGYADKMRPGFEYFLSCGNENMEGERYIQTPEMVKEIMKNQQTLPIEGKNIVFKRWDMLLPDDEPDVVIFFATPDVLSGLFTLANFDRPGGNGVFCPFGAGCSSIVHFPYLEKEAENPRAIIGMFDPSARPCVPPNTLSFALPMNRFEQMISFFDESFLITETWEKVMKRMG